MEICAADDLRTVLWPMPTDNDPASWTLRAETWQHEDVLLGGSDAGAHLDRMCGAPYTTRFLGDCLRGRKLVGLEQAVKMLTDDPARLFGLRERGQDARRASMRTWSSSTRSGSTRARPPWCTTCRVTAPGWTPGRSVYGPCGSTASRRSGTTW